MNTTLPLTSSPEVQAPFKKLQRVHKSSRQHWVGNGFPVRSVFDYNGLGRELTPFLLLDYAAPHEFPPGDNERRGVEAHPHKGFETVTIAYQGELEHRDSTGAGGKIGPGDVQWMTAGNGIIHEELHSPEFTRSGGILEMIQLWVNLPAKHKSAAPGYQNLLKAQIPIVELPQNAGQLRVIAGSFQGVTGPARTFTPIQLWDLQLNTEKSVQLSLPPGHTSAILVLNGALLVNGKTEAGEGDLVIFEKAGEAFELHALHDSRFFVMSGEPIPEPIVGAGPFVMNSRAEIEQAFADYNKGRMGDLLPPAK